MRRKSDPEQIQAMFKIGFSKANIARRLKISEKTVTRALEGCIQVGDINLALENERETDLWRTMYESLGSYQAVAWHFGVSRQAVWEKLAKEAV